MVRQQCLEITNIHVPIDYFQTRLCLFMSKAFGILWPKTQHSATLAHFRIHFNVLNGLHHFESFILMGTSNLTSRKLKFGLLDALNWSYSLGNQSLCCFRITKFWFLFLDISLLLSIYQVATGCIPKWHLCKLVKWAKFLHMRLQTRIMTWAFLVLNKPRVPIGELIVVVKEMKINEKMYLRGEAHYNFFHGPNTKIYWVHEKKLYWARRS